LVFLDSSFERQSNTCYFNVINRYLINGQDFSTLSEFFDVVGKVLLPSFAWGRNLDAFNDILSGGFGKPDEGFELVWKNSNTSREKLGYDETVRVLSQRLLDCHPANGEAVAKQIEDARKTLETRLARQSSIG
jgi:RNAse (barnase) inhibitor barstar